MPEPLTKSLLVTQLERLNAVFSKYDADELLRVAGGYHEALNDLDLEQVQGAVGTALREEPRFPVPAKLREHARNWRERNRPKLMTVAPTPEEGVQPVCRICGAMPALAWLETRHWKTGEVSQIKRYIAPCNDRKHPAGTGYVPFPPNFLGWADE